MVKEFCLLGLLLMMACQTRPVPAPISTQPPLSTSPPSQPPISTETYETYSPLTNSHSVTATPARLPPTSTPTPNYPVYTGPPLKRNDLGLQIHLHREDVAQIFDHLQALNVGWVKVQVSWKLYQPYPDSYSDERFVELDALVDTAVFHHIAVLLSVAKAPEWSRPTTELDGPPTDFTLYQAFMNHLASRYQGRVAAYELWNEMNLQREWNGRPLDAADFVALIRLGATGVRLADPAAILISGAPAPTGINDGQTAVDDRVYFRQMLAAGLSEFVDVIGVHPYGWANPPETTYAQPDTAVPSHNDHPSFFFQDTLSDYASLLADHDAADKPLWVTEFGWGSFDGFGFDPPTGAEFMTAVSEWQQAQYTLRAYEIAHDWPQIGPMILWNLNFGPLLGEDYTESGYSLLRPDGSPRPVYLALQAIPKE